MALENWTRWIPHGFIRVAFRFDYILFYNRLWTLSSTWSEGLWFSIIILRSANELQSVERIFRNLCNDVDDECMGIPVHRKMGENIFLPFRFTHNFVKTNQFFFPVEISLLVEDSGLGTFGTDLFPILRFDLSLLAIFSVFWHAVFNSFTYTIRSRSICTKKKKKMEK